MIFQFLFIFLTILLYIAKRSSDFCFHFCSQKKNTDVFPDALARSSLFPFCRGYYELLMIMIWGNYIRYGRLVNIYVYIFLTKIFEIEGCLGKNRQHPFVDDIDVKIDSPWNSTKRYTPFHIFLATCAIFMDLAISPTLQ